jgi:hypothetical protein
MSETAITLVITDGPDKPALQFALAYPERSEVHFALASDALDARILRMEEQGGGGFTFGLEGVVTSGIHKGRPFSGTYSVEQRAGRLTLT